METVSVSKSGVIGLGAMGVPMARNLHRAGHLQAVWNRTADKARQLADELGCQQADDPAALARLCDLVLLSVSADGDVLEVVESLLPGIQPGTIVVDTSTISMQTAQAANEMVITASAYYLDAPVSGGMEGARNGTLAMMVGGNEEALARARPVLACLTDRIEYMGATGNGQVTKAVNQIMAAGINQAVTEALAFGQAMQLPLDKVIDVIGSGAAANWFLDHRGPSMVQNKYEPGFKVALHHKDLAICKQMAAQFGVALPVIEMTLIHYRRLMEAGFGDEDISALFREKEALFNKSQNIPKRP